jgi:hypothetical protein
MNIPKLCLRLAVFLCTLTIALFVTRFFLIPPRVEVRVAAPATPPAVVAAPEPAKIKFKVQQVVLDRAHATAYAQLIIESDPHAPAPGDLLFSMWLTSPLNTPPDKFEHVGCGMSSTPQPLSQGARATMTLIFHCGAATGELTNNYYAHIVPTYADDSDMLQHFKDDESNVSPAIPVVVEHEQKR